MAYPTEITIYHPYRALFPLDPRNIYSVGDQVILEHILGFHSTESEKAGFHSVISKIHLDPAKSIITVELTSPLKRSDGSTISPSEVADSLRSSFQGTVHSPYSGLFKGISIEHSSIHVSLSKLPVNIRHLFTLPDFAIFDPGLVPIKGDRPVITSGPYSFESAGERDVWLRINPYYPKRLRANEVERVHYIAYRVTELDQFISNLDARKDHLVYLPGFYFTRERENALKSKGYKLNVNPSEWVSFLSFRTAAPPRDIGLIRAAIGDISSIIGQSHLPAQPAYSLMPSDRPYGLDEHEYSSLIETPGSGRELSRSYLLGVLRQDKQNPVTSGVLDRLQKMPRLRVKFYEPTEFQKMFAEADVYFDTIGISPADPLSHFSFLQSSYAQFSKSLSPEVLASIALTQDTHEFSMRIKGLEKNLIQSGLVIPLAHFPGVVIEAPNFEKDDSLAWSWGTQAWTYKIR